jgi:hypothetical protein
MLAFRHAVPPLCLTCSRSVPLHRVCVPAVECALCRQLLHAHVHGAVVGQRLHDVVKHLRCRSVRGGGE